jgi:hypothetical protein
MIPGQEYAATIAHLIDIEEAREAIAEYNAAYERGEEPAYPHWADEVIKHQGE